jgi:hypothetical protein
MTADRIFRVGRRERARLERLVSSSPRPPRAVNRGAYLRIYYRERMVVQITIVALIGVGVCVGVLLSMSDLPTVWWVVIAIALIGSLGGLILPIVYVLWLARLAATAEMSTAEVIDVISADVDVAGRLRVFHRLGTFESAFSEEAEDLDAVSVGDKLRVLVDPSRERLLVILGK